MLQMSRAMLDAEKRMLCNHTLGKLASGLVEGIGKYGYVKAAHRTSLVRLYRVEQFTHRRRAMEHHRRIKALLAIRAVEFVESIEQPQMVTRQELFLKYTYTLLSSSQREWCRKELQDAAA